MSRYLASQGHKVTVITEVPNHPSGVIPPAYRGRLSERITEEGVDVLRLWVWASPEKTFKSRMRFYLSYMGMAAVAGSLIRGKYDLVYATSPPLFVAAAGAVVSLVRRIPFVFEVRDLWPESAVSLGELSNKRAIAAASRLERWLYKRAARIIVVTNGIRDRLLECGIAAEKVTLVPNGANTETFRFDPAGRARIREMLGLNDKFVVLYAGIHGIAQGLENLVEAARILRARSDILFLFVGEGPKKAQLIALKEQLALDNVLMLPEVSSAEIAAYRSAADCDIVPLLDVPEFRGALPSKMFEAWACSRPVILSAAGEAARVLKQAEAGITVAPEDAAAIAGAVEQLASDRTETEAMGRRGRQFVETNYSRRRQAEQLEAILTNEL